MPLREPAQIRQAFDTARQCGADQYFLGKGHERAKFRFNPKILFATLSLRDSLIASSPSFGGRGLEVRVAWPRNCPHPNPLPRAGEGKFKNESAIFFGLRLMFLVALVFSLTVLGCGKKAAPLSESEVKAVVEKTLPSTAEDKIWERVPLHSAKLLLQDMVEPRQLQASTPFVQVQAMTDGQRLVFRLSWNDATMDDLPGPGRFGDAVAVQLPAATTADVPAPQMGEDGKPSRSLTGQRFYRRWSMGAKTTFKRSIPAQKSTTILSRRHR